MATSKKKLSSAMPRYSPTANRVFRKNILALFTASVAAIFLASTGLVSVPATWLLITVFSGCMGASALCLRDIKGKH
jgi:hypothetical protein